MKKRTTICLELTDSQILHLSRLAAVLTKNSDISIRELNFPKEFRDCFESLFWESPDLVKLHESVGVEGRPPQPTELMKFVYNFHKKKIKK